jgi:hypothetical protein
LGFGCAFRVSRTAFLFVLLPHVFKHALLQTDTISLLSFELDSFELFVEAFKFLPDDCFHVFLFLSPLLKSHVLRKGGAVALNIRWAHVNCVNKPDLEGQREK